MRGRRGSDWARTRTQWLSGIYHEALRDRCRGNIVGVARLAGCNSTRACGYERDDLAKMVQTRGSGCEGDEQAEAAVAIRGNGGAPRAMFDSAANAIVCEPGPIMEFRVTGEAAV